MARVVAPDNDRPVDRFEERAVLPRREPHPLPHVMIFSSYVLVVVLFFGVVVAFIVFIIIIFERIFVRSGPFRHGTTTPLCFCVWLNCNFSCRFESKVTGLTNES
jgi:hypothetical protein